MKIESYFQSIQKIISSYAIVQLSNVTYEKRGTYEGFIRGELRFRDASILHFREFVDIGTMERLMYAYQYMSVSKELLFRYEYTLFQGQKKPAGNLNWHMHSAIRQRKERYYYLSEQIVSPQTSLYGLPSVADPP